MKKQKSILIGISLLLHLAMLGFSFDTTEVESSRIVQPVESGIVPINESEKKVEITETTGAKWNTNSAKISMYRQEMPSVVVEKEFVTSLNTGVLLLVILSAVFHAFTFLKLKGSNQSR